MESLKRFNAILTMIAVLVCVASLLFVRSEHQLPPPLQIKVEPESSVAERSLASFSGRVLSDAGSQPIEGAKVSFDLLSSDAPVDFRVFTDGAGAFEVKELPAGLYSIDVTHGELVAADDPLEIEIAESQSLSNQILRLKPGIRFTGRVVRSDTKAIVPNVEIVFEARIELDLREVYLGGARKASTASDGTFTVDGLIAGSHVAHIAARPFLRKSESFVVRDSGDVLEFELDPGFSIAGQVLEHDGTAAVGASVRIDTREMPTRTRALMYETESTSGENGRFRIDGIPENLYTLIVEQPKHAMAWSDIEVGPAKTSDQTMVQLNQGRTIRGRVLDGQGQAVRGARVTASLYSCAHDTITPEARALGGVEFKETISGEAGEFAIEYLAGACYEVSASREGFLSASKDLWNLGNEDTHADDVDLYLRTPGPSSDDDDETQAIESLATISGRVQTADGVAQPSVHVWAIGDINHDRNAMLRTDEEGEFELSVVAGEYFVQADAPQFAPARSALIVVEAGERREDIVLELSVGAFVEGKVTAQRTGEPVGGATVLYKPASNWLVDRGVKTDRAGNFRMSHLPEGEFSLSIDSETRSVHGPYTVRANQTESIAIEIGTNPAAPSVELDRVVVKGRLSTGQRPISGFTVAALDPWGGSALGSNGWRYANTTTATTDPGGGFQLSLPAGERSFLLLSDEAGRSHTQIDLAVPSSVDEFEFERSLPSGRLHGVVLEKGTAIPISNAFVEVFDAKSTRQSYLALLQARRGLCTTDYKGRFSLEYLPSGTYSVCIDGDYDPKTWTHGLTVSDGEATETRIEFDSGGGVFSSLPVVDGKGSAVTDVGVLVRDSQGNLVAEPGFSKVSLTEEVRALVRLPSVSPGSYEVTLVHPKFAPLRVPLRVSAATRHSMVAMTKGGSLEMIVRDRKGEAVPKARIAVFDAISRNVFDDLLPAWSFCCARTQMPLTAQDGSLLLKHLAPGAYRIVVSDGARSAQSAVVVAEGEARSIQLTLSGP